LLDPELKATSFGDDFSIYILLVYGQLKCTDARTRIPALGYSPRHEENGDEFY
jgi:hypothetical protein